MNNTLKRVLAIICLIIIFVLIGMTLYTGVTGKEDFLGWLTLMIIVPVFMYVFVWLRKLFASIAQDKKPLNHSEDEKDK